MSQRPEWMNCPYAFVDDDEYYEDEEELVNEVNEAKLASICIDDLRERKGEE